VRLEIVTVMKIYIMVFWIMTPYMMWQDTNDLVFEGHANSIFRVN